MTYFFQNTTKDLVPETVDGFLQNASTPVAKLDVGNPLINVVVRPDWTKEKADKQVAIISGGGSGHEPMHAGFVGEGMLTAAVCGGLFASPSYEAVLSTILHVAGNAGVFVIVKAYTGDCLIFGLAVEKAKALGVKVEMIIFSDDISIPDHPRPRGLAGTILMHKICGYYAEQKKSLEEIKNIAQLVMESTRTIGVSLTSCRLPTATGNDNRVKPNHAELGLGIHGEPGVEVIDTQNVEKIIDIMVKKLTTPFPNKKESNLPIAILINNLGGTSNLEMGIICSSLLKHSFVKEHSELLIGPATLCTSLDMKGFSITFISLQSGFADAIKSTVHTAGWVNPVQIHTPIVVPGRNQGNLGKKKFTPSQNEKVEFILRTICNTTIENEAKLNELDSFTGDGDTGLTFASGSRSILAVLEKKELPLNDLPELFENIAEILGVSMGGSSGILLSILMLQTASAMRGGKNLQTGLVEGVHKMMELGGAKLGFRTMIDSLLPAVEALKDGVEKAAVAAEEGAEKTKNMEKAGAGRSTYLNAESLKGHPDAGACGVAIVFRALADKLK